MSLDGLQFRFEPQPGERGVSEMLALMSGLVKTSRLRGMVPQIARSIVLQRMSPSPLDWFEGVYDFLREHIEYEDDPPFTDQAAAPDTLLMRMAYAGPGRKIKGDCDDVATLGASLVHGLGFEPVFLVMGKPGDVDENGRVKLRHVFYGARYSGHIIPYDPQEKIPPGQLPPAATIGRLEVYKIF